MKSGLETTGGGSLINREVGCTINTAPTQRRCDASNYIAEDYPDNTNIKDIVNQPTEDEEIDGGGLPIVEATKKGYKMAHEGDGIDISTRKNHRGTVQKGLAKTIKTQVDVGVVIKEEIGKERK